MPLPKKLVLPGRLNPRLVTKTSLPDPKRTIALVILLWYAAGKPGTYSYGLEVGEKKKADNTGILDDATANAIQGLASKCGISLPAPARDLLAGNALFESQIEALNAAFELIWHLASFSFADKAKNRSAERKGGLRFRKVIHFTCNMDLIDMVAQPDESAMVRVAFSWLTVGKVECDKDASLRLARTLAAFAETSFYKTKKGDDGIVYTPSGIYDVLVEGSSVVNLTNEGEEVQGTTRILKPAIKDGLNPMLVDHDGNEVARNPEFSSEQLSAYSERSKNTLAISSIEISESDTSVEQAPVLDSRLPFNLIYFGAPGTGKSYQLGLRAEKEFSCYEGGITRVTFHPDYTYAQFVGCYKPISAIDVEGKHEVYYDFTPGPFVDVLVKAMKHPDSKYVLLIEEINRANPAAVFGDVFQLLDRNGSGQSEYPIRVSQDLGKYLYHAFKRRRVDEGDADVLKDLECSEKCVDSIIIPSNMYLWATMNSADQGVFPMDTAFKRRWDFHYMSVDEGQEGITGYHVPIPDNGTVKYVKWNDLRKAINKLLVGCKVNEDKLIGPYFIKRNALEDESLFMDTFKDKVLLYLFEDAAKMKKGDVFQSGAAATYSQVCESFDKNGLAVFKNLPTVREMGADDEDDVPTTQSSSGTPVEA